MASAKKRKMGDEGRMFNKEWENSYFFVEISEKPVCLRSKRLGSFDDSQQKNQSQYTAVHILIRTFR